MGSDKLPFFLSLEFSRYLSILIQRFDVITTNSSPASVNESEARKLPRWLLFAVLIAFVLPLFFSSDVWSGRSLSSFGVAWNMANGSFSDWLMPNINDVPVADAGPLSYWLEAISILLFGRIFGDVAAYHIAAGLWFAITTASIWYTAYSLASRDEALPLKFVFASEVHQRDYARALADIAVLMTVGTYGLIAAFHELSVVTAVLAFSSFVLFCVVISLRYLWTGSILAGLSLGAIALCSSPGVGLWCALAAWVAIICTPDYTSRTKRTIVTLASAFSTAMIWPALVFLAYPAEGYHWFGSWLGLSTSAFAPLALTDYPWLIKNLIWLTFPLWPLAIWGVYSWRNQIHQAPVAIPLSFFLVALCSVLFTGTEANSTILCIVPSLAILAAFGIVSLKHSEENVLDTYAIVVYTLAIGAVWFYFYAWTQGEPEKMAYSLTRLAPNITEHGTSGILLILALVMTVAWLALVFWRLFRRPIYIWRGALLNGAGLTAVWVIVMSLFVSLIDGASSMQPIADSAAKVLAAEGAKSGTVAQYNLTKSDIAAFNYWGGISFNEEEQPEWVVASVNADSEEAPESLSDYRTVKVIEGRPRSGKQFLILQKVAD